MMRSPAWTPSTEERIADRIERIMEGRTTILISHRTRRCAGRRSDRCTVDGKIFGTRHHDELLAAGGYYADLYQKQLLEENWNAHEHDRQSNPHEERSPRQSVRFTL